MHDKQYLCPLGFITPVVIGGRLVIRKAMNSHVEWDEALLQDFYVEWEGWRESLSILPSLRIPRVYSGLRHVMRKELHTFCDASKKAIWVVTYVKLYTVDGQTNHGFVMAKSKRAPHHTN